MLETLDKYTNATFVLKIGDRFFVGFGKKGRVKTAWSLAGAKHFGPWMFQEHTKVGLKLIAKGYQYRVHFVHLDKEPVV